MTSISAEDLTEIAPLRVLLESHALGASIEDGDTKWERDLAAAHLKLHVMKNWLLDGDMSETEKWKRYDSEFHLAFIRAYNSQNLLDLHATLYNKYLQY